ncbi:unnamed protein product [Diamesa hyperborea]
MPGNVKTFLNHVHAEREKPKYIFELPIDEASENWFLVTNDEIDNLMKNQSSFIHGENLGNVPIYSVVSMCSSEADLSYKNEIDYNKLNYKKSPYIPLTKNPEMYDYDYNGISGVQMPPNKPPIKDFKPMDQLEKLEVNEVDDQKDIVKFVRKRSLEETQVKNSSSSNTTNPSFAEKFNVTTVTLNSTDNGKWTAILGPNIVIYNKEEPLTADPQNNHLDMDNYPNQNLKDDIKIVHDKPTAPIPHFHVTYWMFYPFSQGKTMCTLNLGPLGPWPIPLIPIFNICLGTKKEFGNHIGDWEHMSLFFRGRMEPDEMYVSAHDAGAFYSYDRLTGTFEFTRQETRKGILQHPNFPKTVITSENHPVLFAAEGSHGLWASPGKHRFVRVPRLYDINGFGQPWLTWKNVEIIYNEARGKRSISQNPNWMKYRGRWGNPKSRCHPLRKIGLHFCERSDGPTGIPKKTDHFKCSSESNRS